MKMTHLEVTNQELNKRITDLEDKILCLEQKIIEAKKKEEILIWGTDAALWDWNYKTGLVSFSDSKAIMLGFLPEELNMELITFTSRIHPDDYAFTMESMRDLLSGKNEKYEVEYRIKAKNGEWKWFYDKGKIIERDENNKPLRILGINNDITEKKTSLINLTESEERFRNLFNYSIDGIRIADSNGIIIEENPSMVNISGFPIDQVIGRPIWDVVFQLTPFEKRSKEEFNRIKKISEEFISNGEFPIHNKVVEHGLQCFDGTLKKVESRFFSVKSTNGHLFYCIIRDVTEIKKTQADLVKSKQAIEESEQKYRLIAENTSDGILVIDANTQINYVSKSYLSQLGYTEEEELTRKAEAIYSIIHPEDRDALFKYIQNAINERRKEIFYNYRVKHKKGHYIWREDHAKFNYDNNGTHLNSYIICRDITQLKYNEIELNNTLSEYNAIFNHRNLAYTIIDKSGKINGFNNVAEKYSQVIFKKTINKGQSIFEFMSSDEYNCFIHNFNSSLNNENVLFEKSFKLDNGLLIFLLSEYVPIINHIGQVDKICLITQDITEKKQNEISAKKNEELYRLIAENSSDVIWVADLEFNINYISPSINGVFGYTQNEIINAPLAKLIAGDHLLNLKEYLNYATKKYYSNGISDSVLLESEWLHKNGSKISIEFTAKFIFDESGKISGIQGTSRDITRRVKAEQQIRKLQKAVESSKACILISDYDGKIEYANSQVTELTGYSPEEYIGKTPRLFKTKFYNDQFYKNLWTTIKSGRSWQGEFCNRKKNGDLYWEKAIISPIWNNENEITNFVSVKTDITELKKITEELFLAKEKAEESKKMFESMAKNVPGVIFQLRVRSDGNTYFSYISEKAKDLFELSFEPNDPQWELAAQIPEEDRKFFLNSIQNAISEKTKWEYEGKIITGSGLIRWFIGKSSPIMIGNELVFNGIMEDITDRKNILKELTLAKEKAEESDLLKTTFLNNISHEIRTPLNAILGFSELLAQKNPDNRNNRFFDVIKLSCNKLIEIVSDIIEVSQLQASQSIVQNTEFNLIELINTIVDGCKQSLLNKEIELIVKIDHSPGVIHTRSDKFKINKILKHLIDNAIKFTNKGSISLNFSFSEKEFDCSISDTGIGISREMQNIIFDAFRQIELGCRRNYGGNGVGLTIAKGYIKLLGGRISLQSELNIGTTVNINIPLKAINHAIEMQMQKTGKIETILVVEDERSNFEYLKEALNDICINILYASDGEQAIEICQNQRKINLILMDIKMPGMDGHTAAKIIKELRPDLPIIAQTAYALESDMELFLNNVFDDYVCKPIQVKTLFNILNKYIL